MAKRRRKRKRQAAKALPIIELEAAAAPTDAVADREAGWVAEWWRPVNATDRLERIGVQVARWRLELEIRLAGAILNLPRVGMVRADECGVTADLFAEREDARLMYLTARWCFDNDVAEDTGYVLGMALHALRISGWENPNVRWWERGFFWSVESLVSLADGDDGPGEVAPYAGQLRDLDRRLRVAENGMRRSIELLEDFGRVTGPRTDALILAARDAWANSSFKPCPLVRVGKGGKPL